MAGPNLELFKFGLYLFFPLAVMVHYGDPEWYHRNVLPIRDQFWPKEESLYRPPRTSDDLRTALDEMKAMRLARREERLKQDALDTQTQMQQSTVSPTTPAAGDSRVAQLLKQNNDRTAAWTEKSNQRLV